MDSGSTVEMVNGRVWLTEASYSGSRMKIAVGPDATLVVEGGQHELTGRVEGKLKVNGGTVRLANISGGADIDVSAHARLVFDGGVAEAAVKAKR